MPLVMLLVLWCAIGHSQPDEVRQKQFNVTNNLALAGYDAISYFTGKPLEGKRNIRYVDKGISYWFSTRANLEKFKINPEKYLPAYGGWCAYAMGKTGEKIKVDPQTYKIVDGKLYLFYNFWTTNTLEDWNKNEQTLKESGDRNWSQIVQ